MPLVRIDIPNHYPSGFENQVGDLVYQAMLDCLKVPADDKFQILTRHAESELVKPGSYLGIEYSDQLIIIQITLNEGRTTEVKKLSMRGLPNLSNSALNIRKEDVMISLVEVK